MIDEARRAYITQEVRKRLHQTRFRTRVLAAYRTTCAICRLREAISWTRPTSSVTRIHWASRLSPTDFAVQIHHAAFDRNIIGLRPDFVMEVQT